MESMLKVALLMLMVPSVALALPADQSAAQDAFVSQVESHRDRLNLVQGSYDDQAKLFAAELKPGIDQDAVATALIELQAIQLEINSNWVFGSNARQVPELKPLIDAYDELDKTLRYGGTLIPTAGVSPSGQAMARNASMKLREAVGPWLTLQRMDRVVATRENQETLNAVNTKIQAASSTFSGMSDADRTQAPGGRALFKNILMIMRFVEETDAQWQESQATAEADRRTCESRRDQKKEGLWHIIQIGLQDQMSGLMLTDAGISAWLERNTKDLAATDAFAQECKDPETYRIYAACYPEVHGEDSLTHFYKDNDPEAWCQIAPRARALLAAEAIDTVQKNGSAQATAAEAMNAADSDGWVFTDSLLGFDTMFSVTPERRSRLVEPVQAIFDQLGIDQSKLEEAFAPMERALKEQGDEALARAPGLKRTRLGSTFYGVDLAKTQVKRVFPSARVVDASSHADWAVTTNALGVPLYRDRNGNITFQVEGESFCQERQFTATEDYTGGGYAQDRGVLFRTVRWLPCDQ